MSRRCAWSGSPTWTQLAAPGSDAHPQDAQPATARSSCVCVGSRDGCAARSVVRVKGSARYMAPVVHGQRRLGGVQSPVPSSVAVSHRMQRQSRVGTGPELALRRLLHARGYRYRVAWQVPGKPRRTIDLAFTKRRVAVFVDGCFWHVCPQHATDPRANAAWWAHKLATNVARDRDTDLHLRAAGWSVVRVWEHEPAEVAVALVEAALLERSSAPGGSPAST